MDVDIYGKPRSYPGSNIEERTKSLMETIYNPEPTKGRSLWEADYVADLETDEIMRIMGQYNVGPEEARRIYDEMIYGYERV